MHSNSKFRDEQKAASAVIGVILGLVIIVAIAATIYYHALETYNEREEYTPYIEFLKSTDKLTVRKTEQNIKWNEFIVTIIGGLTFQLNNKTDSITDGQPINSDDYVLAGDFIKKVTGTTGTITIIHIPTNSFICRWEFN